ncbi:MAG: hypothetical protein P8X46_09605, partial [Nitrospirales bacterium]
KCRERRSGEDGCPMTDVGCDEEGGGNYSLPPLTPPYKGEGRDAACKRGGGMLSGRLNGDKCLMMDHGDG